MKTKISFILNDFINKMNEEEIVNIYDKTGFSKNMAIKSIPEEYRKKEVIKYKKDEAMPNIHFKLKV